MVILNTTFVVSTTVMDSFLQWVEQVYIPAMERSRIFGRPTLSRILAQVEPQTESYALQARCFSFDKALGWHDGEGATLRQGAEKQFGTNVLPFSTFMEVIR